MVVEIQAFGRRIGRNQQRAAAAEPREHGRPLACREPAVHHRDVVPRRIEPMAELLRGVAVFGKDDRGLSHPPQQTQQRADFGLALRRRRGRIDQPMKGALLVALVRQTHPAQLVVWRGILTDLIVFKGSGSWSGAWLWPVISSRRRRS